MKLLRLLQDGSYYLLGAVRPRQNRARVIVATNHHVVQRVDEGVFRNDLETAVHCMQAGAIDYLVKPVENNRLVSSVRRALELRSLRDLEARP